MTPPLWLDEHGQRVKTCAGGGVLKTIPIILAALCGLTSPTVADAESWILWESVEEGRLHPVDSPFASQAACVSRGQGRIAEYRKQFKPTRPGAVSEASDGGLSLGVRWPVTTDPKAVVAALTKYRESLVSLLALYERELARHPESRPGAASTAASSSGDRPDYLNQIHERIKSKWIYPYEASSRGIEGELQIEFGIAKSGELQFIKMHRSSGIDILDDYAMRAVQLASPFPPLPAAISKDGLPINGTFKYRIQNSGLIINVLDLQGPPEQAPLEDVIKSAREQSSVTLDVTDFPYAWYLRQVLQKVEERWQTQNRSSEPAQKPRIYVEIQRDGSIAPPRIEQSAGSSLYDREALRAITEATPFPPLPADWANPSLRVLFNFGRGGPGGAGRAGLSDEQNTARQRNIDNTRRSIAETDRHIADAKAARPTTKWVGATALRYQCWPVGVNPQ
jgi:TonB family protein